MHEMTKTQDEKTAGPSCIHRVVMENGGAVPPFRKEPVGLKTVGLTKRYGETLALSDASVDFRPGIHTILGENGSGKSTMLKILSGVVTQTKGSVLLNDRAVSPPQPARHARSRSFHRVPGGADCAATHRAGKHISGLRRPSELAYSEGEACGSCRRSAGADFPLSHSALRSRR